eukprot:m51a1_g6338 hypothetical protein (320) ;mRNA; r:27130-28513
MEPPPSPQEFWEAWLAEAGVDLAYADCLARHQVTERMLLRLKPEDWERLGILVGPKCGILDHYEAKAGRGTLGAAPSGRRERSDSEQRAGTELSRILFERREDAVSFLLRVCRVGEGEVPASALSYASEAASREHMRRLGRFYRAPLPSYRDGVCLPLLGAATGARASTMGGKSLAAAVSETGSLTCLVGMPGVGKTASVVQLARDASVWVVYMLCCSTTSPDAFRDFSDPALRTALREMDALAPPRASTTASDPELFRSEFVYAAKRLESHSRTALYAKRFLPRNKLHTSISPSVHPPRSSRLASDSRGSLLTGKLHT